MKPLVDHFWKVGYFARNESSITNKVGYSFYLIGLGLNYSFFIFEAWDSPASPPIGEKLSPRFPVHGSLFLGEALYLYRLMVSFRAEASHQTLPTYALGAIWRETSSLKSWKRAPPQLVKLSFKLMQKFKPPIISENHPQFALSTLSLLYNQLLNSFVLT